ncbi:MAG: hypothetical protein JJD93_17350 [Ilumatobacteraceae bacterium]|nr:hypothetical protein [Ilumatobacteraceae bacterium]
MASDSRHLQLDGIVGPFAELLLATDLPQLLPQRRAEVVQFVQRRARAVPSFTRFGVTVIGLFYRGLIAAPGGRPVARFLMSRSLPILGEYPRLVRSLGYAYIWEHWPDTSPTGAGR